jgi:hypothetical protein
MLFRLRREAVNKVLQRVLVLPLRSADGCGGSIT